MYTGKVTGVAADFLWLVDSESCMFVCVCARVCARACVSVFVNDLTDLVMRLMCVISPILYSFSF